MPLRLTAAMHQLWLTACLLFLSAVAFAQQRTITGRVTNAQDNSPVAGATVSVRGTNNATQTDNNGAFSISVPQGATALVVSYVGFDQQEVAIGTGTTVDVGLRAATTSLNEVVVTGYSTQRKKDIIGAVSVISAEQLTATPSANLASQLQGRAAGVVVSSTGAPGASAVVRIRGFQSFGNNNPLYVIDGVPTGDPSLLNPEDIESIQILKDATSASIYGTRAANGVVIVTTKQGRSGRAVISYDSYAGVQAITKGMQPELLNNQQYIDYLNRTTKAGDKHVVFGQYGAYALPDRIVVSGGFKGGTTASDPRADMSKFSLTPGSVYQIYATDPIGTNWFDAVTRTGLIQNHQLTASGGTDKALYTFGLNYFDQEGTFKYTDYNRYTVRANSSFKPFNFLRVGQNLQVSYTNRLGNENLGEGGAWAQAYRMVPYIPVNDMGGGWGGNGMGESGNGTNPVAQLARGQYNTDRGSRIFGNAFAELTPFAGLTARSSFGVDNGAQFQKFISFRTYERQENQGTTQLTEQGWNFTNWTWTNTLNYKKTFAANHDVTLLAGSEAIKNNSRGAGAYGQGFDFDDPDFITLDRSGVADRRIFNVATGRSTIFSLFGRLDYAFKGRYLVSGTIRRDGASVLGSQNRYGTFPSVGLGWRISEEAFMQNINWISDLKLRAGWGEVGSISNVSGLNAYSTFESDPFRSYYDINGGNTGSIAGYRASRVGNPATRWETTESKNVGLDLSLLQGKWDLTVNVFQNDTRDLLVTRLRNSLEPLVGQPLENIGTMRNSGYEVSVNNRGRLAGDFNYDVSLNLSHYRNELVKMNNEGTVRNQGVDRLSNALVTQAGLPVSSFIGYNVVGFYNTDEEVAKGPKILGKAAQVGTWRYEDVNGDGDITTADRKILGSPHPDFQLGANFGLNYKNFDFNAFLFWNQGSEIFNNTKYFTDMRVFVGGVSTRVLNDSWTPGSTNAKLPRLGTGTQNGYTSFVTGNSNSYYVEDGSYLRAKTVQLGYTLPKTMSQRVNISRLRLYVQAQNLFTVTNYSGADPDVTLISGNGQDTYIGVDRAGFPNPKMFLLGLNVNF